MFSHLKLILLRTKAPSQIRLYSLIPKTITGHGSETKNPSIGASAIHKQIIHDQEISDSPELTAEFNRKSQIDDPPTIMNKLQEKVGSVTDSTMKVVDKVEESVDDLVDGVKGKFKEISGMFSRDEKNHNKQDDTKTVSPAIDQVIQKSSDFGKSLENMTKDTGGFDLKERVTDDIEFREYADSDSGAESGEASPISGIVDEGREFAQDVVHDASQTTEDIKGKTKDAVSAAPEKMKETVRQVKDEIEGVFESGKRIVDNVKAKAEDVVGDVKSSIDSLKGKV
ncbi:hypothetical protein HK098_000844 [Nowakowskiella sp. JEL0407]|nr:hypothetical protein HK098_000844 [Nowakowskiella sp. JEL0407]